MALLAKKQASCVLPCRIVKWTVCALLFLAAVAALIGVYNAHVIGGDFSRIQFGSTGGSLSILAFVVAVVAWMKHMVCCMSRCEACSVK